MFGHGAQRYVLHAGFDAFCVAVERACNPSLRGRPVVIGGTPQARGVVMAASHEARLCGIWPSMPVSRAAKLCHDLVIVQGNDDLYRRAARAVTSHLQKYSPLYERPSTDEAYLDLTGIERLFGAVVDVGARLRREIIDQYRLELTVGVASNKLVSRVASEEARPGGIHDVPPGGEAGFLAPLPIIRLPGVGPATAQRLVEFNIETIHELAGTEPVILERILGRRGRLLHAHAQGVDDSPVGERQSIDGIENSETLAEDSNDLNALSVVVFRCVERVGARLRAQGLMARGIGLTVGYVDGVRTSGSMRLDVPTDIDHVLNESAELLIPRVVSRRLAVRHVAVRAGRLTESVPQLGLFTQGRGYERSRSLLGAIDRIRRTHGVTAIGWAHVAGPACGAAA
ncbi:MAG: DNA polymerase IV [Candidatus Zixiibacteriota bacterium]